MMFWSLLAHPGVTFKRGRPHRPRDSAAVCAYAYGGDLLRPARPPVMDERGYSVKEAICSRQDPETMSASEFLDPFTKRVDFM